MICKNCGRKTIVTDSRYVKEGNTTRRRHECSACKMRFTTYEISDIELAQLRKAERVRDKLMKKIEDFERETKGVQENE